MLKPERPQTPYYISRMLQEEGMTSSRKGVANVLKRYRSTETIARRPGSGRLTKMTEDKRIVEEQMRNDDETTAYQLHQLSTSKGYGISLRTILRCRTALGCTFRGSSYCQLIRDVNKTKRLEWAREYLSEAESGFEDVIWSDEATVQLETHRRFAVENKGSDPGINQGLEGRALAHIFESGKGLSLLVGAIFACRC